MGMYNGTATWEDSLEVSYEVKHTIYIQPSNPTEQSNSEEFT